MGDDVITEHLSRMELIFGWSKSSFIHSYD